MGELRAEFPIYHRPAHSKRMNIGFPSSRAINPVVVKTPPPMILLTSRQLAVNQPIVSIRMPARDIVEAFLLSVDSPTISAHGREANKETTRGRNSAQTKAGRTVDRLDGNGTASRCPACRGGRPASSHRARWRQGPFGISRALRRSLGRIGGVANRAG